jgi:hypothetical protein
MAWCLVTRNHRENLKRFSFVAGYLERPRFTPWSLYPWHKSLRYPLYRRLGGLQSQYGRCGQKKKFHHCPCREQNPGRPVRNLVTVLSGLHRLPSRFNYPQKCFISRVYSETDLYQRILRMRHVTSLERHVIQLRYYSKESFAVTFLNLLRRMPTMRDRLTRRGSLRQK